MKAFTTFLVDPHTQTISEVQYRGEYEHIYELINCDTFDAARINRSGDSLFVDDEGLFKDGQAFFVHADYPQPLAGKALVLGCDREGETVAPTTTLAELRKKVLFVMPIKVNGDLVWLDTNGEVHRYCGMADAMLKARNT